MDLSIIIPAFNEAAKIEKDILASAEFLKTQRINGEIIVIDDGSSDNTRQVASALIDTIGLPLSVTGFAKNRGKGAAVREGIIASKGEMVMYADAGSTVPLNDALTGIALIKNELCHFAFGSRKLPDSIISREQDYDRKIISTLFERFAKLVLHVPAEIVDTQCGFKIYDGQKARQLFEHISINGFLFEIEFVRLAVREDYIIKEFPITWCCDRDSRLSIVHNAGSIILEIISVWFGRKKGS